MRVKKKKIFCASAERGGRVTEREMVEVKKKKKIPRKYIKP